MGHLNGICPECRIKTSCRHKAVDYESFYNWFYQKSSKLQETEYRNIVSTVWFSSYCSKLREKNQLSEEIEPFLKYVDDIVRTVKGDPKELLNAACHLYPNQQITLEKAN